jgi:type I restriction enzyme M protein
MSNHNDISSFIWRVCDDILRGLFKPYELIELYNQIKSEIDDPSPIIMRRIRLPFYNHSTLDLRRLKSIPKPKEPFFVNAPKYFDLNNLSLKVEV